MELNYFKYFFVVAKEGSFTRASQVLRIQQPTISKMVQNLENQLGVVLIERNRKGLRLTKMGEEVYQTCAEVFSRLEDIRIFLDREKSECFGPLSFGITDAVCAYLIPRVMGQFVKQHPKVRPSLFSGSSNLVCNEMVEGRTEFGICFTKPNSSKFEVRQLAQIPFLLVKSGECEIPNMRKVPFIISREIDYPKKAVFPVLEMLNKNRIKFEVALSSNNLDSQKEFAKEGLGAALLPGFMVKSSLQKGSLVLMKPNSNFTYPLHLVTLKGKVLSKNASTFLETFSEMIPRLI